MSTADGSIIIDTRIDEAGFHKGLSTMKSAVVAGMAAITAAIGAASVAVIQLGSEFEQANAKASTLFGDAQVNMQQYQGKMLDLSNKTGLAASELGSTMYDALSAGIPASDDMSESLEFLEKNTRLAKAGFTDINTATTATAKVLNAYKMDVTETDRVHKVLMQTQNKGITTVNELGSVLSQVTPTAAAMSVSFEQVGAALANMTAQGTPTAQATTQLNQLFAELGKSGTTGQKGLEAAAAGTEYAGKSFQDLMKEGVPLSDVINLMANYAEKNGLSMIDMFSSIEAGKAALAVSGQNAEQFTENLKAMKTETDVVGDAYDKVTDTFKEKSAKVVNSLKNVGIAAYEKFQEPLKGAMDSAQSAIDELSKNVSSGKLNKSIEKIADAFGKLIKVSASLASKAIPLIVDGFGFLVDHGKLVISILSGIAAAMATKKIMNFSKSTLIPMVNAFKSAKKAAADFALAEQITFANGLNVNNALTLGQAVVGVLTGKIKIATAAHAAWNAVQTATPWGWIGLAVGAAAAGIAALALSTSHEKDEADKLNESIEKQTKAMKESHEAAKARADESIVEIERLRDYKNELDSIVDADGRVKAGFEKRASFLTGELAKATGLDIKLTGDQIQGYKDLSNEIDNTIAKMKAEAIVEAYKEDYTNALKTRKDSYKAVSDAERQFNSDVRKYSTERDNFQKLADKETNKNIKKNYQDRADQLDGLIKKSKKSLDKALKNYDDHNRVIMGYDQAMMDVKDGNFEHVEDLLDTESSLYKKSTKDKKKALEDELDNEKKSIESLKRIRNKDNAETIDAEIRTRKRKVAEKKLELFEINNVIWSSTPEYAEAHKYLAEQGAAAYNDNGDLTAAARTKIDNLRITAMQLIPEYSDALAKMANDGKAVFDENGSLTAAAQKKLIDVYITVNGMAPEYGKKLKEMADNGKQVFDESGNLTIAAQKKLIDVYATMNGISPEYAKKLKNMAENGEAVFDENGNLTDDAKKKINDAGKAIDKNKKAFIMPIGKMASEGKDQISMADTYTAGANFVKGAIGGISDNEMNFINAVDRLAGGGIRTLLKVWDEHSPSKVTEKAAKNFVQGAVIGIEKNKDALMNGIETLADDSTEVLKRSLKGSEQLFIPLQNAMMTDQLQMAAVVGGSFINNNVSNQKVVKEYNANLNVTYKEPMSPYELSEQTRLAFERMEWNI